MTRSFFPRGKECLFTGPSERKLSRVSYRIAAKQLHALWTMVDRPLITNPYLTNMYFLLLAKLYNDQVIIEELTLLVLTLFLAVWLLSAGVVRERERESGLSRRPRQMITIPVLGHARPTPIGTNVGTERGQLRERYRGTLTFVRSGSAFHSF